MPMNGKRSIVLGAAAACLAALPLPLASSVPMTGGPFSSDLLIAVSGGGPASGGAFALDGANMGGPSFSSSAPSGGNFSLETGAAPATAVYESASADLSAAHCYPVPFKPSAGHAKITFTGLTYSARISVYTLSGRLVRSLDKNDPGSTLDWDVKNSAGEGLASGVYIFVVKSPGQTRHGKLMVIR